MKRFFAIIFLWMLSASLSKAQEPYQQPYEGAVIKSGAYTFLGGVFTAPRHSYVRPDIEGEAKLDAELNRRYEMNSSEYHSFLNNAIKNLDANTESLAYRSQMYAINKFMAELKYISDNKKWTSAFDEIQTAETNFYLNINEYRLRNARQIEEKQKEGQKTESKINNTVVINNNNALLKEFDELFNQGTKLYSDGRYKESIAVFDNVIRKYPDNPYAYYNRAMGKYYSGDKQGACADMKIALQKGANDTSRLSSKYCD